MGVIEAVNGNIKASLRRGPWLSRYELSASEGAALSGHQVQISRSSESRVVCAFIQILVQTPYSCVFMDLPGVIAGKLPGPLASNPAIRDSQSADRQSTNFGAGQRLAGTQ